jgi:hypothetical protein
MGNQTCKQRASATARPVVPVEWLIGEQPIADDGAIVLVIYSADGRKLTAAISVSDAQRAAVLDLKVALRAHLAAQFFDVFVAGSEDALADNALLVGLLNGSTPLVLFMIEHPLPALLVGSIEASSIDYPSFAYCATAAPDRTEVWSRPATDINIGSASGLVSHPPRSAETA